MKPREDLFFRRQPPLAFIDELLSPLHKERPSHWQENGKNMQGDGVLSLSSIAVQSSFPDPKGVLNTSLDDFTSFLQMLHLDKEDAHTIPLVIRQESTDIYESYTFFVGKNQIVLTAQDTEGIRRGLIYIQDEIMRNGGPWLKLGKVTRKPHMRTRISRCFFSPINRPPKNLEELADLNDYYPENYLLRLMHEGVNAIWIYTRFQDLVPSDIIPEFGQDSARRIKKLNKTIAKCARYGIAVYLFAIEPMALSAELYEKYPQVRGNAAHGTYAFCTRSQMGEAYCREAVERLFALAPDLGGYMSITMGERLTSCGSVALTTKGCTICKDYTLPDTLAQTVNLLAESVKKAKPDADFISWTYGHRLWNMDDILDYVAAVGDDLVLMQNFEDMGIAQQLGKDRLAMDYWLSYAGPSEMFEKTAMAAREHGKELFAKLQVCCSHEVASVPYLPVPGLLYDKYSKMFAMGVTGAMQCWYFGNYPSLMSKAAGELAFWDEFSSEEVFLTHLAGIYWGRENAGKVVTAWKLFDQAYREYPINVMFSYYGPMHDGPVWELQLLPKNNPLPRSWQTIDPCDGDRISECLLSGHTLEEAIELCTRMQKLWGEGLGLLEEAFHGDPLHHSCKEQWTVAQALYLQFTSGLNILHFYQCRDILGKNAPQKQAESLALLEKMRTIVVEEMEISRQMEFVSKHDVRLGYHSEGEGFKYFPEKLQHRIKMLENLLATEFVQVMERIGKGLAPLAYYSGQDDTADPRYTVSKDSLSTAPWENVGEGFRFRMARQDQTIELEIIGNQKGDAILSFEYDLLWPSPTIHIDEKGEITFPSHNLFYYSIIPEREQAVRDRYNITLGGEDVFHLRIDISLKDLDQDCLNRPMKMRMQTPDGALWSPEENPWIVLGKPELSPGQFGWLLPG